MLNRGVRQRGAEANQRAEASGAWPVKFATLSISASTIPPSGGSALQRNTINDLSFTFMELHANNA